MQILAAWVPAGYRLGVILHWRLPAPHELAREVDRSFMQLPTRPFCSSSVCRTNETSMRHASACTMHGRRGGALVRLVPQRAATLGGGARPLGGPYPPAFPCRLSPVDSAAGAGQLHFRSALRAAILTPGAGRSEPLSL